MLSASEGSRAHPPHRIVGELVDRQVGALPTHEIIVERILIKSILKRPQRPILSRGARCRRGFGGHWG